MKSEALAYVDAGADFYLRVMGDAVHMELRDNGVYEIMRSAGDVNNLASVCNMRLEGLSSDALVDVIGDFAAWCDLDNNTEHHGTVIFHAENHFRLIKSGKRTAFLGIADGAPVATCGILNNDGVASLEFVSVQPDYRKRGIARLLCQNALGYAFANGAVVVTTRAIGGGTGLCKALDFCIITT